MSPRQELPRIWLVTDERQGDRLLPAVARLPERAGILFRHYRLPAEDRRALFLAIHAVTAGHVMLLAGPAELARDWGADGWHGWGESEGLRSASVHDLREIRRAEAQGADLLFLGPIHPTRSHPAAPTLGLEGFARLAAAARHKVIALGGMSEENAPDVLRRGAYGWGAVDFWVR